VSYEQVLAAVLRAPDPGAALADRLAGELPDPVRAALARVDPDGLRVAALLVVRLRFERVVQGSGQAAAWFEADPRAFTAAFKRFHAAVAPTGVLALEEGAAFEVWLAGD